MSERHAGGRRLPRRALRIAFALGALFLAVHLLLPQVAGLEATAEALSHATWWLPALALALEAGSFWSYGELELVVLRDSGAWASRGLIQRTTIVGSSLGKTLPGGNTAATAVVIGALHRQGLPAAPTTSALAASGIVSWAVLALLLPVGAILALVAGRTGALALGAAGAAAAILALAALLPLALRRPERIGELVAAAVRRLAVGPVRRWVDPEATAAFVVSGIESANTFAHDRRALLRAGGWAAANWLLDVAVLAVLAATIGSGTPLLPLLLAYVIGQLLAAVPITPGGVGLVEPAMIGALVASGAPFAAATATVLGWRLVSHWLPIAAGLLLLPTVLRRARPLTHPAA